MNTDRPERNAISERIIGCTFTVANTLGRDFRKRFMKMRWRWNCAKRGLPANSSAE